jgi:uncharacterized protein YndB with AHSA1/START domain
MWSYEHSVLTVAAPEAVWRLWADVAGWRAWNADIDGIEVSGPFEVGSEIVMNPAGEHPVRLRLTEVDAPRLFVDEADLGDLLVRTTHRIDAVDAERRRVTYRTEITGSAADELGTQVGPAITADFPDTIGALVRLAESAAAAAAPASRD